MAKRFLPKCSSIYSDSLLKPSKQWQLISGNFSSIIQYSSSSNNNRNDSNSFNVLTNKNYSMYTEAKQQLASQHTYFNDSLLSGADDTNKKTTVASTAASSSSSSSTPSQLSSASKKKSDLSESRERLNHLRYFYNDPEIDRAIEKPLIRLNPMAIMYMGVSDDNSHLLKSANYLRSEIPIRYL